MAGKEKEARFYASAIGTCWKVVFSDHISEEYQRVMESYGYPAVVVLHEMNKLYSMNKYRRSEANPETIDEDLAPRKDRHIVAPCKEGVANLIVTHDSGILAKKVRIQKATQAQVLSLTEAQARLENS